MNNLANIIERADKIKVELSNLEAQFRAGKHWVISYDFRDAARNVESGMENMKALARRGAENEGQSGEQGQD